jgi:SAM-dependent methyltransferase
MSGADQARVVEAQFGPRAEAYLQSAVHAQGADLTAFAALLDGSPTARLLDLGCGGGHMAFAAAPHVAEVVAYDLSSEMLAVVARAAAERDLTNLVTQRGRAESLPFADAGFDWVASRFSAHHWPWRVHRCDLAGHAGARHLYSGGRTAARHLTCARLHARGMGSGFGGGRVYHGRVAHAPAADGVRELDAAYANAG